MKKNITVILAMLITLSGFTQNMNGLSPVFKLTGEYEKSYGYINEAGKLVIQYTYEFASDFSEGYSRVMKNDKYGFVDESGKLVIPCEYSRAYDFENGYAQVEKDNKTFYINTSRKTLTAKIIADGFTQIEVNQRYGFIDKNGELIIPADYNQGYEIFGNHIICRDGGMSYAFDFTGKLKFETEKRILSIKSGFVIYNHNSITGVMDELGNVFFETDKCVQGTLSHYSAETFYGLKDGSKIFFDKSGNIIEQPVKKTESAYLESAEVKGNYIANLYDSTGKLIKSYDYDSGVEGDDFKFINGLARIHLQVSGKDSKDPLIQSWGGVQTVYVNMKGEIVWKSNVYYSCFPENALITLADRTQKKISEIKEGDLILSFDFTSQKETTTLVENVIIHNGEYSLNEITVINADNQFANLNLGIQSEMKLLATPNHPIYTNDGVKPISALKENDKIITLDESGNSLEGIVIWNESSKNTVENVYNLKTKSSCYFVNGILVMMK